MEEKRDELKGRAEEAAGVLADDSTLKREGQIDRARARIKEILEEAKPKVDDPVKSSTSTAPAPRQRRSSMRPRPRSTMR